MVLSVQYMRAIAAFLVVIHHCAWKGRQYSSDPWGGFTVGECGVDLFFVISGYIMCRATSGRRISFPAFMRARALRILPLYWLLSLVALGVFLVAPQWVNSQGGETRILDSFLLWPSGARFLINNGWTLSYEFLFYGIFGLGLLLPGIFRLGVPMLAIVMLVTSARWLPAGNAAVAFLTHPLLLEFAMGMAAYVLLSRTAWTRAWSYAATLVGAAGLAWVNQHGPLGARPFYYGVPCALLFLGLVGLEEDFVRQRSAPWSRFLHAIGDSSYSLYLVHSFALGIGVIALRAVGLTRHGHAFALGLAFVSLVAGLACYHGVEQPLSRFLKRAFAPRTVPGGTSIGHRDA
ncbi:MAG: acyltransferase [Candidatus Eisenbacteria bacterium]